MHRQPDRRTVRVGPFDASAEGGTSSTRWLGRSGEKIAVWGDFDADGLPDIFKTHFSDDLPALYRNTGRKYFDDASRAAGFDISRYVQWGTGLVDFDNDGWQDILIATGSVYPEVEKVFKDIDMKRYATRYLHLKPQLVVPVPELSV